LIPIETAAKVCVYIGIKVYIGVSVCVAEDDARHNKDAAEGQGAEIQRKHAVSLVVGDL
jgi:hypothetical protein